MLLGGAKLNTIEVLISKALIHKCFNHGEFVSVNNVLREYNEMKKEIRNSEKYREMYYITIWKYGSCKKNTVKEISSVTKTKQSRLMLLSNCAICDKKKQRFIKNQELH